MDEVFVELAFVEEDEVPLEVEPDALDFEEAAFAWSLEAEEELSVDTPCSFCHCARICEKSTV